MLVRMKAGPLHPSHHIRLYARIDSEPNALERLLQPFAVLSMAPVTLGLRPSANRSAFVVAEFAGIDRDKATLVVRKLGQLPCVRQARLGWTNSNEPGALRRRTR